MGNAVSAPALSQIESGKMRPSESTIAALASALDVPAGFFSVHRPDAERSQTYFRDLRATTARERRRAAAQALLLSDLVAALGQYVRLPEVDIPHIPVARAASREEINEIATRVRRAWGLGSQPIPHVVRELERHGLVVARLVIGHESVDAFSTDIGLRPLVLLTNDKADNYVRSRFDAAHELGHHVMHDDVEPGTKEVEKQAQDFAASFLLPEDVAYESLPSRIDATGWSRLAELKRTWGISMAALLFRAKSLRIISLDAYQSAMRYVSARGWRTQEPGDRELGAPEAPLLLERSIRRAAIEAGISDEKLIREAHLPLDDLLDLLEAAVDDRPIIEL
jgi:Zn-dependent peptidase ImmA (M78 family)/transcriptional regulator with XRE-family HTH domain